MTTKEEYNRIYNIGFDNSKRETLEEVEKMIKKSFNEGEYTMKHTEDTLIEHSDIKKMLYTPYGIFKGTELMILEQLTQMKEKKENA
jgi:hypothetical protein